MDIKQRIASLASLGKFIQSDFGQQELESIYYRAEAQNGWFAPAQSRHAIEQIASQFLDEQKLQAWASQYPELASPSTKKTIGLVLAGNIPAVGFHDILSVFVAGHKALIKYSAKDKVLIPFLLQQLAVIAPETSEYFEAAERLQDFDAVIATGSDNSSRYFEHYFSQYPHIIRRNRNSVAVLSGKENKEELDALAEDIFRYYGLGCRSVSKIYVPEDFDFQHFMASMDRFSDVMENNKFRNNFDYNRSLLLLNGVDHLVNGSLAVIEEEQLVSRIATLHYEKYAKLEDLNQKLVQQKEQIQTIVTKLNLKDLETVNFGETQLPALSDYADGVDTLAFLESL